VYLIRSACIVVLLSIVSLAPAASLAAAQETYKVGDRVEWNLGDIWFKGTVYNVDAEGYQIERDGYGRAREKVTAADLRRLPGAVGPPAAQPVDPAPARVAAPAAPPTAAVTRSAMAVGDRVEWNIGDMWFAGTIYAEQAGQYRVNRDQYGRATEWTTAVRRLTQRRAEAALTAGGVGAPFRNGERVEVNVAGTWMRGNVGTGDPASNRYVIDRENPAGDAPRDMVVTSSQVRRLSAIAATASRAPLPQSIPEGEYQCQLYLANSATVGRLRILPGGVYTGLSTSGTGQPGRYAYDPATGKIDWGRGLLGFSYTLQGSAVESNGGPPFITVHYQIREGGSINSMSCVRAGR
jgi:hypothetical protein